MGQLYNTKLCPNLILNQDIFFSHTPTKICLISVEIDAIVSFQSLANYFDLEIWQPNCRYFYLYTFDLTNQIKWESLQ